MRMKGFLCLLLFMCMLVFNVPAFAYLEGTIGNDSWVVEDGDIVPQGDYDIGESGSEVNEIFVDALTLNGEQKTSWGSVVSPMTDYDGYVTPTDAGSKLKLHDDGDLTLGGGVATDVAITFDGNAQDFYLALDDTADQVKLGYGSVVGTTSMLGLGAARSLYVSDGTTNDFQIILDGGAQDFHIGIDDTGGQEEDLLVIGRGAATGTTDDLCIGKASGTVYLNHLDAPGNVDLDIGSADVDDVTIVTDGGTLILDGTITLTGSEVISNATDDTVRVASNDAATVLEVYTPGTSNEDASLLLTADADADAGDRWQITHDGATNDLLFQNDTASADTVATIYTLAETGIVTTTNYIEQKITDTTTNAVVDVAKLTHDGGAAAAGVGTGLVYQIDDAGGIEEQGSIDVSLSTVTNASEDADMTIRLNQGGTMRDVLKIDSDPDTTSGTVLESYSWTTETNGVIDILELNLDNTADTATDGFGAGISVIMEDETDVAEQQASIDFVLTDAGTTAEDCDVVISQNTAGAIAETLRLVAASSATVSDYLQFTANTTETDAVVDVLKLKIATGTAEDNSGMGISFEPEDATGSEQHASIDIVQTTAARATNDTDFVFTQDVNGTLTERVRFDADGSNIVLSGATPAITIGDAGEEDTQINYDGAAQDYSIGVDDTDDTLQICAGTALGTTPAITIDANQDVTFTQDVVASSSVSLGYEAVTTSAADPGVGVASITDLYTAVTTDDTGASADVVTLAAGAAGQMKIIKLVADTETAGLSVTADYAGASTAILFEDVNDLAVLVSDGTEWHIILNTGGTVS